MFKINSLNNINTQMPVRNNNVQQCNVSNSNVSVPADLAKVSAENLRAYIPSFTANTEATNNTIPSRQVQIKTVKSKLDKQSQLTLNKLEKAGILDNKDSNDGSSVLDNLYKIATEPRIRGLSDKLILKEVLKAIDNPYTITQRFGDIPDKVASEIAQETGMPFPEEAKNVMSSSCVVTSMEFNLASKKPAEFARFAQGLSGKDYSITKNIKLSDISTGIADALWNLRTFNTDCTIARNWEDLTVNIKPDRNAIVRARVQTSYKDPGERSCVDVLIQSALLNLGSQHTYNTITDERTGSKNPEKTGLTDEEKNFVESIVFEKPKYLVTYQEIDNNGRLAFDHFSPEDKKQHILKTLASGENIIVGYIHLAEDNTVMGGHEITIVGYQTDEQGNGYFVCNDTDDGIDEPILKSEKELLPLIHHAGIGKTAFNETDVVQENWRIYLNEFQAMRQNQN